MPGLALAPTTLEDAMLTRVDAAEVLDHLDVMREQEETTYRQVDYLVKNRELLKRVSKPIDADCRVKMCEWCYQVVDFCKFRRETVSIGMSYLDRYLMTRDGRSALANRKEYQLTAMTALYIAIKIHEPLEMETALLADLSRGCYEEMEFVEMEERILVAIEWRVGGPTALGFIQHFMALVPDSIHPGVAEAIMEYARYQTELAISEHSLVDCMPSEIALAAIMNAMEGMDVNLLPPKASSKFIRTLEKLAGIPVADVESIQVTISMLLVNLVKDDEDVLEACVEADFAEQRQVADSPSSKSPGGSSRSHQKSPVSVTRKEHR